MVTDEPGPVMVHQRPSLDIITESAHWGVSGRHLFHGSMAHWHGALWNPPGAQRGLWCCIYSFDPLSQPSPVSQSK